jgi:hypothetical protein
MKEKKEEIEKLKKDSELWNRQKKVLPWVIFLIALSYVFEYIAKILKSH